MRSIALTLILFVCFSPKIFGQNRFFWNQYGAGNPAATGTNSDLDISSITDYYGHSIFSERLNAEARIKKLHGAVGAGYRLFANNNFNDYLVSNPYLNYSFHIKTGENSLLAFGANVDFSDTRRSHMNADQTGVITTHYKETRYGLGAHFQYKRLKAGVAISTYDDGPFSESGVELSDLYIDYTFKFGENWQLQTAAHAGSYRVAYFDRGNTVMARAIYKNKYWFGASLAEESEVGLMAGINLNDRWNIGYSIGTRISGGSINYITSQSLVVRFQMPWK